MSAVISSLNAGLQLFAALQNKLNNYFYSPNAIFNKESSTAG